MTPQQVLLDEMGTYYIADELEISPDFTTEYAELIADSADRVRAAAGPQGLDELVALLRALRENSAASDPRAPYFFSMLTGRERRASRPIETARGG
jgi:hypothetical protein